MTAAAQPVSSHRLVACPSGHVKPAGLHEARPDGAISAGQDQTESNQSCFQFKGDTDLPKEGNPEGTQEKEECGPGAGDRRGQGRG